MPPGRKATYGTFIVDIKEHKEKECTRLTVGGYQMEYPGDKSTRTACLTTAKVLINNIISTKGARFLVVDIKNFYPNTPLTRFEYICGHQSILSPTVDNRRIRTTGVGT
jgi:hypothetical protein